MASQNVGWLWGGDVWHLISDYFRRLKTVYILKLLLCLYKTHNGWLLVYSLYILFKNGYNRSFSWKFCLISIKERVSCFSSGKGESPLVPGKGVRSSILLGDWDCAVPPWERGFEIGMPVRNCRLAELFPASKYSLNVCKFYRWMKNFFNKI